MGAPGETLDENGENRLTSPPASRGGVAGRNCPKQSLEARGRGEKDKEQDPWVTRWLWSARQAMSAGKC